MTSGITIRMRGAPAYGYIISTLRALMPSKAFIDERHLRRRIPPRDITPLACSPLMKRYARADFIDTQRRRFAPSTIARCTGAVSFSSGSPYHAAPALFAAIAGAAMRPAKCRTMSPIICLYAPIRANGRRIIFYFAISPRHELGANAMLIYFLADMLVFLFPANKEILYRPAVYRRHDDAQ